MRTNGDEKAPMPPPGRTVDLPGRGRTFVRELPGPEGAPAVVLLHGWTTTAALNWAPSFTPLADHFRVIAPDLRGHGRGLRADAPFRLEDCADDVAALLDELGIGRRCIVVGYSMGGAIAQLLERRHPEQVGGLVLCATSASFSSAVHGGTPFGLSTSAVDVCWSWWNLWAAAWSGVQEIAHHDWVQVIEAGRQIVRFDSRSWIAETSVPTAVIATRDDAVVPHRRQLALATAIPGATLHIVPGGHTACSTAADAFVDALVDACTDVARRAVTAVTPLSLDDAA